MPQQTPGIARSKNRKFFAITAILYGDIPCREVKLEIFITIFDSYLCKSCCMCNDAWKSVIFTSVDTGISSLVLSGLFPLCDCSLVDKSDKVSVFPSIVLLFCGKQNSTPNVVLLSFPSFDGPLNWPLYKMTCAKYGLYNSVYGYCTIICEFCCVEYNITHACECNLNFIWGTTFIIMEALKNLLKLHEHHKY